MLSLRHLLQARWARTMYSPFGLAWLRARDRDTPASSYRNAPWPTPALAILTLRAIQQLWPRRRIAEGAAGPSQSALPDFYVESADAKAFNGIAACATDGLVIAVNGAVTERNEYALLSAISRVQATWPEAAWRLDIETKPSWLASALKLSVQQPARANRAPAIALSAPAAESDIDVFVAKALAARETAK